MEKQQFEATQEEIAEAIEHRDILLDVRAILTTKQGQSFFKYMLKYFSINDLPDLGLDGPLMYEQLGKLRASHSIWKLLCEANPELAGQLLAAVEKEEYAKLYRERGIGV